MMWKFYAGGFAAMRDFSVSGSGLKNRSDTDTEV